MVEIEVKNIFLPIAMSLFFTQAAIAAPVLGDFTIYTDKKTTIAGGGSYGDIASNGFSNAGGVYNSQTTLSAADRATLTAKAGSLSQTYAGLAETTYSLTGSKINTRVLHGVSGDNVITLSPAEADSYAFKLTFDAPGATSLILNIPGTKVTLVDFLFGPGTTLDASKVLFNFFEATEVSGSNRSLPGTILAPLAHVSIAGSHVGGSIVSNSFGAANTIVDGKAFFGFTPPPVVPGVPEPATWAMLILGFGFVGSALRRRTRASISFA